MDSEKGNRVFARGGGTMCPPPLVFGAQKKPGLDRVNRLWSPLAYGLGGNYFSLSCRKIGTHCEKVNEKQESGMKTENENIPGRKRSMQVFFVSKSNTVFPLQLAYA